jgi:hypothetical protein
LRRPGTTAVFTENARVVHLLWRCFQHRARGGFGSRRYEEIIYVNNAFGGVWFSEGELAEGDMLTFTVDGLTEWVAQSGLVTRIYQSPAEGGPCAKLEGT